MAFTVIAMLDRVPEYKLGYVLAYIQGITADEDEDDAFCQLRRNRVCSTETAGQQVLRPAMCAA